MRYFQIGAKRDDFCFLDENNARWRPFPTYPLVLDLKGDHSDIAPFAMMKNAAGLAPGLPIMDPKRMVVRAKLIQGSMLNNKRISA